MARSGFDTSAIRIEVPTLAPWHPDRRRLGGWTLRRWDKSPCLEESTDPDSRDEALEHCAPNSQEFRFGGFLQSLGNQRDPHYPIATPVRPFTRWYLELNQSISYVHQERANQRGVFLEKLSGPLIDHGGRAVRNLRCGHATSGAAGSPSSSSNVIGKRSA